MKLHNIPKHLLILAILIIVVLIIISTTMALTNSDFDLSWWTVDGGGGTSDDGSLGLSGTSGQPDAGNQSGGEFTLGGGYWTSDKTQVFIPMIMKNFCGGFARARELEDNDTDTEANGPLCFFKTYAASPDSDLPGQESDYYYINWDGGQFTVSVTNFLTTKAQVQLYYQTVADRKAFIPDQASGNYVITYNGAPGKYLIRVVAEAGHAVGNGDYNLRVTRP